MGGKEETKERMGRSPDLFDFLACACEGARRKGFIISKLALAEVGKREDWLSKEVAEYEKFIKGRGRLQLA